MSRYEGGMAQAIASQLGEDVGGRLSPARFAGIVFYHSWMLTMFYGTSIYGMAQDFRHTMYVNMLVSLLFLALANFAMARIGRKADKLVLSRRVSFTAGGLLAAATLISFFSNFHTAWGLAALYFTAVTTGICSGVLFLGWVRLYADAGSTVTGIEVPASFAIGAVVSTVVSYIPSFAVALVAAFSISVSAVLLRKSSFSRPVRPLPARSHSLSKRTKRMFLRGALAVFGFGIVEGFFDVIVGFRYIEVPHEYGSMLLAAGAIASILASTIVLLSKRNEVVYLYRFSVLAIVFGCLSLPFVMQIGSLPGMVIFGGYLVFLSTCLAISTDISNFFDVPAVTVGGYVLFAIYAGEFVGSALAYVLTQSAPSGFGLAVISAVFAAFVTVLDKVVFTEKDVVETRIGEMVDYDLDSDANATMGAAEEDECLAAKVADLYGLSARERDVLPLLIKGRTIARIQEELFISQGTVSTHIRHIYQKAGVQNRQALLDLIDEHRKALREER